MATKPATKLPREKNMSNKGQLLQDPFLNTLRKEHVPVSIYLVNGIKLQGQIESFDQYVVLLRNSVTQSAGAVRHALIGGRRQRPDPKFFAGSGKIAEIGRAADEINAAFVIFNH